MHRIVIVGGGAGGLELATRLGDRYGPRKGKSGKLSITLIDKNRTHIWKPKLHEIAAGSMDLGDHEVDYIAQAHWHHFTYRIGQMIGLDRERQEVIVAPYYDDQGIEITPQRAVPYDTLVLSIGSLSNDFATPGVEQFALRLESQNDAKHFHTKMLNAIIRAQAQTTPLSPDQLHVAIIGAGATGVELAAELYRTTREVVSYGLDKAPDFLKEIAGLETNRINQLAVLPTLQTTRDSNIFAMGDCAACPWPEANEGKGGFVPPRAQAAHQQASHLFKQIQLRMANKALKPYRYRDFGSLVSLGKYSSVGSMMGGLIGGNLMIEGSFAKLMYLSLYKMHELALHGWVKVSLDTLARMITRRTEPHVKLH